MNETKYTCPMHPEVVRERPGMCPECGMALVATSDKRQETRMGHDLVESRGGSAALRDHGASKHAGHSTQAFKKKFWVSLVLSVPVVLYSDVVPTLTGWTPPEFFGSRYIPAVLGSIIFFYGGWIFLASARRELRARLPGMMTLIALAISAAYLWSIYALARRSFSEGGVLEGETLFWELATLITVMLLGHWLEMRAVSGAQGALKELSKLLPDTAEVILRTSDVLNIETKKVPLSELRVGDIFIVRPGGKIAADGVVAEGRSDVNESLITGESKPVLKEKGAKVIAGSINGDGSLKVNVEEVGERTFLAGVMRLVEEAQASKSRLQVLSDRAAFYLTVIAVVVGSSSFIWWFAANAEVSFAVERLVAVLVIACPHALGLAVPLVASISTTKAARGGFLVKQRLALEAARNIDIVIFDKTGTLTRGEYGVTEIVSNVKGQMSDVEILRLAASVDSYSEHFIARAIVGEAKKRKIDLVEIDRFERLPGKGVRGQTLTVRHTNILENVGMSRDEGAEIFVGGEAILVEAGAAVPEKWEPRIVELGKQGKTIVYVVAKSRRRSVVLGAIVLADIIREESREAVRGLKTMGVKTAMITGDSEDVARWVAEETGIDEYFSKVLPGEKAKIVKKLQAGRSISGTLDVRGTSGVQKLKTAFVGDGINDAPALTQADIGIAVGAGTNVAIESAGIILVRNDPRDIVKIIRLSRMTHSKMLQNLFWATGYNVVALPLAAGVLAAQGILLQPALAAVFMSASTVIVAINAMFLRSKKIE